MRLIRSFMIPVLIFVLCSCGAKPAQKQLFSMATVMAMSIYAKHGEELLDGAADKIFRLNTLLDRNNRESEVAKLNQAGGGEVSPELRDLLQIAAKVYKESDGCFDLTVAPLVELWGFYDKEYHVPTDTELAAALSRVGFDKVSLGDSIKLNGTELDFGGIAKGYAADVVVQYFQEQNVKSALLSLGGNVYAMGTKPDGAKWRIAIADPKNPQQSATEVQVENKAVITSGIYQRNFEKDGILYHHILNPKTGKNPENSLASVTVIGEQSALCDALSTAFFVMGMDKAVQYLDQHEGLDAVFIDREDRIFITSGIAETFKSDRIYEVIAP